MSSREVYYAVRPSAYSNGVIVADRAHSHVVYSRKSAAAECLRAAEGFAAERVHSQTLYSRGVL